MKERPINFKAWEVQAILDGRKTQFRRVVKNAGLYAIDAAIHSPEVAARELIALATRCPFGVPGDRLWVRETWAHPDDSDGEVGYKATDEGEYSMTPRWRSSIHMPREASRITLEVVSVRVERLNEISEEDAIAEGIQKTPNVGTFRAFGWRDYLGTGSMFSPIGSYRSLWQSINGPGSWAENPWVWVVEFRVIKP